MGKSKPVQRYTHPCDMTELQLNMHGVTHYCRFKARIRVSLSTTTNRDDKIYADSSATRRPVFQCGRNLLLLVDFLPKASCSVSSGGCCDSTTRYLSLAILLCVVSELPSRQRSIRHKAASGYLDNFTFCSQCLSRHHIQPLSIFDRRGAILKCFSCVSHSERGSGSGLRYSYRKTKSRSSRPCTFLDNTSPSSCVLIKSLPCCRRL